MLATPITLQDYSLVIMMGQPALPFPSVLDVTTLELPCPDLQALGDLGPLDASERDALGTLGVFAHVYYDELADELARQLLSIETAFQLYITTDAEAKAARIRSTFGDYLPGVPLEVRVVPNVGWDLAPFLLGCADAIPRHPYILRLHAKRSNHLPGDLGDHWRHMVFDALAGSRHRVRGALRAMLREERIGMAAPPHFYYYADQLTAGDNLAAMQQVLSRWGLSVTAQQRLDFPMSAMFWCRSEALQPLLDLALPLSAFVPTQRARDASLAHALERCFFHACGVSGLHWTRLPSPTPRDAPPITPWNHELLRMRAVDARLRDVLHSTSWRITAPLRWIATLLHRTP